MSYILIRYHLSWIMHSEFTLQKRDKSYRSNPNFFDFLFSGCKVIKN